MKKVVVSNAIETINVYIMFNNYLHISNFSLNLNLYCKKAFFDWFQLILFIYFIKLVTTFKKT
jgi:hypothetical protein